ncbi:hypothetical protein EYB25_004551 [Talaromyces marneffei]|uniref:molybdopterin adenylyltransferase n=1 Tax=Talaromyces marneffei PM1 TaxID=1077442 RepID=A0A093UTQ5_TALMA|nr:uncharacterized protein EYB26_004367 [Talaromyces marneffei]KAE8553170.1 hypothetical protein EYB25_004551 [Talaromyces marneffei]QGA16699.1 hypothetical protein EYB26_004367 [Talaromyces marneffei]
MALTYHEAILILQMEATDHRNTLCAASETVPLGHAVNRITSKQYCSLLNTPQCDTSAMDGYAVNWQVTQTASEHAPVICQVRDTIAAGGKEVIIKPAETTATGKKIPICVEIMTGARFPRVDSPHPLNILDCCVKVEDTRPLSTSIVQGDAESSQRLIQILKPARLNQNKRLAGEDFRRGDVVVDQHVMIKSNHVMALASVGVGSVEVLRRPRIALFSTGAEIVAHGIDGDSGRQQVSDVNGPYITSVLREAFPCEVDFLGILEDNPTTAADTISSHIKQKQYDMVITTGAVSMGRYDFIPQALKFLRATVLFHKVAMRPGHPALFAKIASITGERNSTIPFFGLPGNPVAAAACLRFLVFPFLRCLLFQGSEKPRQAVVRSLDLNEEHVASKHDAGRNAIARFPPDRDIFRAGTVIHQSRNHLEVEMIQDHSPGKISPFLAADCWIHIPREKTILHHGDVVDVFLI